MEWWSLMEQEETRLLTRMRLSSDPACSSAQARDPHQQDWLWAKVTSLRWSLTRWVKQVQKLSSCPRLSLRPCAFSGTISVCTWKLIRAKIRWLVSSRLAHVNFSLGWIMGRSKKSLHSVFSTSTCTRVSKGVAKVKFYLKKCSIEKEMCIQRKLPTIGHPLSWLAFWRSITDSGTTSLKTTTLSYSVNTGIQHLNQIFISLLRRRQKQNLNSRNLLDL